MHGQANRRTIIAEAACCRLETTRPESPIMGLLGPQIRRTTFVTGTRVYPPVGAALQFPAMIGKSCWGLGYSWPQNGQQIGTPKSTSPACSASFTPSTISVEIAWEGAAADGDQEAGLLGRRLADAGACPRPGHLDPMVSLPGVTHWPLEKIQGSNRRERVVIKQRGE
jgi:hypothetical protein